MKNINPFIIFSLLLAFAYILGLLKFLTEYEEDKCEMTYMFEYPQYVKISNKADSEFKKYGLYAYSEGRLTEKARNMYFDGIPVLFIPGNAGSHKQVRSLSSIALRKWLNSKTSFHFDYFTVDLNEEYSGLYGPLLFDQLQYIKASLLRILELYGNQQHPPETVVVIGHSMGGIIAMRLISELQHSGLIPILITLASPLNRPLLNLDFHMNQFYDDAFENLENTTVISVSGGYLDLIVNPFMTQKKNDGILQLTTTNIPISWTGSNHVQILWCKQVVMALNRALFDSVDRETHQISKNVTFRNMVFKHHLVQHSGTKIRNRENYSKLVQMNPKGRWMESIRRGYSLEHSNGVGEPYSYMIALSDVTGYEILNILAVNSEVTDWVFVCNAYFFKESSRICKEGFHLSHLSEIAPSTKLKRRFFRINMSKLKKYRKDLTHIVFKALPTDEPVYYHVDIHSSDQRSITVNLPNWFSLTNRVILERTAEKAIYYELSLPHLSKIMQFYKLIVEPLECSKSEHHASVTLTVPWSNENYNSFITNTMKKPVNIRLHSSKPSVENQTAVIKLILDPSCTYKISIQSSPLGVLGQLARTHSPLLISQIAAVSLITLRYQLINLEKGHCSILFVAIQEGAKPYYAMFGFVISLILSSRYLPDFILKPDYQTLENDGLDFILMPLVLFVCGIGLFWILVAVFSVSLIAMESTVHKIFLKLLARTVSFNVVWSNYLMSYLHKIPVIVALTLISLSLTTCGGLALCLGTVFYFLRLTQMSQNFVEEVVWYITKKFIKKCKRYFSKSPSSKEIMSVTTDESKQMENTQKEMEKPQKDQDLTPNKDLVDEQTETNTTLGIQVGTESEKYEDENIEHETVDGSINSNNTEDGSGEKNIDPLLQSTDTKIVETTNDISAEGDDEKIGADPKPLKENSELSTAYHAIYFHSSLFFLWCIVTAINLPAVLTWAHNFKYSSVLETDDSFIPGLALSISALMLWQCDLPRTNRKYTEQLEKFLLIMTLCTLVFSTISIYRLNYILTLTIIVVTLHQLLAPETEVLQIEDDSEERTRFSEIKTKIE
ncbi:GPI inositol-deacylase isoform X1 [Diorhabda carinulata]|uniref:GPI inositol-deacylase isoform X1 n=1 Tax=Diorhabda carinulata TaxID=1163345 RepID=UPI0025A05A67|nr:GPI inositol-deacylase isoform X1 [Diorhabda carinulata]